MPDTLNDQFTLRLSRRDKVLLRNEAMRKKTTIRNLLLQAGAQNLIHTLRRRKGAGCLSTSGG